MTQLVGKVLARREGDEVLLLIAGQMGCHQCPALKQYVEDARRRGARKLAIDLADCKHCDSTFLGTLLALKRAFDPLGGMVLVHPSAEVRRILAQMGAEQLFTIVDQFPPYDVQTTWQQIDSHWEKEQNKAFKRTVVEAHEELAAAGGALAARFGPLAEAMREELRES
jgi:anti-anti-sigma factor